MAVISKGGKGSWILLNMTFLATSLNSNITIYEKLLLEEFGTLTLIWSQSQRTLDNLWLLKYCPRTHPPCSQGCGCWESIHPQRGCTWLQLHSIYAYKVVCSAHFKACSVFLFHLFPWIMGRPKRSLCRCIPALSGSTADVLRSGVCVCSHGVWATCSVWCLMAKITYAILASELHTEILERGKDLQML